MAREKDEAKRAAIVHAAKRHFAQAGFHDTSMADLATATGLPVGSLYTYFENKEALVRAVIEEGWGGFFADLAATLTAYSRPEAKLAVIIYRILPSLFDDVDLISILLTEGARYAGLEEKLEALTSIIADLVVDLARERGVAMHFPPGQAKAALAIFFLGSLDAVRLTRNAGLGIPVEDLVAFIRAAVENSFRIDLDPSLAVPKLRS